MRYIRRKNNFENPSRRSLEKAVTVYYWIKEKEKEEKEEKEKEEMNTKLMLFQDSISSSIFNGF